MIRMKKREEKEQEDNKKPTKSQFIIIDWST